MRLAIVASHPIQYHGPLFRELARRVDLTVFFAHRAAPIDQANAGFGVEFDWDIDLLSGYEHSFLLNVADAPNLTNFYGCDTPEIIVRLAEGRFDAVLVMGWHLKSFIQAVLAARRLSMPVLVRGDSHLQTPRGAVKRMAKALAYPAFLRLFDAALYVGHRSRAYWTHYRYPEERLFFSPHCVDDEWFASRSTSEARTNLRNELGLTNGSKVVLFAGKLVPFKRPLDLVSAVAALSNDGCKVELIVAGMGTLKSDVEKAAHSAGLSPHMLGFCNQSRMPAVYAAADVLVLPSDARETWGLVANEALACRRPVVVSDAVGAAPDLAVGSPVCRVYPEGNVRILAETLRDVLRDPPANEAVANQSKRFSVAIAVEGIERAAHFAIELKDHSRG